MSVEPKPRPLAHLWETAKEYVTHWFTAGVILTLTGFTPDHWVERLFHGLHLDALRDALPAVDYRLLVVGIGVAISTCALIFQNRRGRKEQLAAALVSSAAPAPGAAPVIEDLDDIAHKPSIAVLPFVNMSDDKSQEFFADGMTEDIITGLSCDSRLFVVSRNSTFVYKGKPVDVRAVGKDLGVRYVLEGSIRPMGDRLRITVQLIETVSGAHVWADKIDHMAVELFTVSDEVVDNLVMALCANLGVAEANRAQRQRPENLQAWALCVQAEVLYLTQPETQTLLEAEKLARRAADIEPGYAVSWALLGWLSSSRIIWGLSADLAKNSTETLSLISKALRLAPNDPTVLGYCGAAATWAGQAAQGIDCLERSLAINPNNSNAQISYGIALWADGRPEEGITQLEIFLSRSPKDPSIAMAHVFVADCYLALGKFQQAEQSARNAVKYWTGFFWGYLFIAMSLSGLGRDAEAQQQMNKVRQLESTVTRQNIEELWNHMLRKPGHAEKMIALLRQVWRD
ncbi:MAG: tetratricopeptide repeat protein [Immundisolibacter sp.]|uniref:tetratricopeptide repeat protein n=1 Tax=Immundisolibacter sp. TaxID=1934948 RepID=UPI003EE04065